MVPESRVRSVRCWRRGRRVTGSAGSSLSSRAYLRPPLPRPPGVSVSERGCWEGASDAGVSGRSGTTLGENSAEDRSEGSKFSFVSWGFWGGLCRFLVHAPQPEAHPVLDTHSHARLPPANLYSPSTPTDLYTRYLPRRPRPPTTTSLRRRGSPPAGPRFLPDPATPSRGLMSC